MNRRAFIAAAAAGTAWVGLAASVWPRSGARSILNASYDATRELYRNINALFAAELTSRGETVRVRPSHGGSGKQALGVREGLPADVVSLAVWPDTQELAKAGLLDADWLSRFPHNSTPYTSTIVFVVRKGNPHRILDWPDLIARDGLRVIVSNPKIGGAAKLALIAAWGSTRLRGGSEVQADRYCEALFNPRRIPVLEGSSRSATQTFARKRLGDVHVTWESEANLELRELQNEVDIIRPPISVLAEPHVAVVDANVRRHGTAELARDYVRFLYGPAAQAEIARLGFRPTADSNSVQNDLEIKLFSLSALFPGGWSEAQTRFFNDGGLFDRAYR
jgi:sulfate/thiosulfate transport system substrate-binding protein